MYDPTTKPVVEKSKKCCTNCSNFEERTGFCRYEPPTVIMVKSFDSHTGNERDVLTAKSPKISMPDLDYCNKAFENKHVLI